MKRRNVKRVGDAKNTQQKQIVLLIGMFFSAIIICSIFFGSILTQAAPQKNTCKYYTSIQIKPGDTLWDIASTYITEEYDDRNEYIREVCTINHILGNEIHAGQFLVVPYYSDVNLESN